MRDRHTGRLEVPTLREWGVRIVLDPTWLPQANDTPAVFPWEELRAELLELRSLDH